MQTAGDPELVAQPLQASQSQQGPHPAAVGMPMPLTMSTAGSADPSLPPEQGLHMTTASNTVSASQMSTEMRRSTTNSFAPAANEPPGAVLPRHDLKGGTLARTSLPQEAAIISKDVDLRPVGALASNREYGDTFDIVQTVRTQMPPPPPGAPVDQHMEFLHQQLDSLGSDRPLLDGLVLLGDGDNERLQGGAVAACRKLHTWLVVLCVCTLLSR